MKSPAVLSRQVAIKIMPSKGFHCWLVPKASSNQLFVEL